MKKKLLIFITLLAGAVLASCGSSKKGNTCTNNCTVGYGKAFETSSLNVGNRK